MFQKEKAVKKNITLGQHFAAALDEICKEFNTTNREVLEAVLRTNPEFMKVYNRVKGASVMMGDCNER